MNIQPLESYRSRFPDLSRVATDLQKFIASHLTDLPRIDRVSARAKSPERFDAKANKKLEDGSLKYSDPMTQIQDQIGARVVVFYETDVAPVADVLETYFRHVERQEHVPDSYWKFGYFGLHWVFALPGDVIPSDVSVLGMPRFFELQVKTLFQHAWSEANHELAYKAPAKLSSDQQRRFAYTAAQAWGADRVFRELNSELFNN